MFLSFLSVLKRKIWGYLNDVVCDVYEDTYEDAYEDTYEDAYKDVFVIKLEQI